MGSNRNSAARMRDGTQFRPAAAGSRRSDNRRRSHAPLRRPANELVNTVGGVVKLKKQ